MANIARVTLFTFVTIDSVTVEVVADVINLLLKKLKVLQYTENYGLFITYFLRQICRNLQYVTQTHSKVKPATGNVGQTDGNAVKVSCLR